MSKVNSMQLFESNVTKKLYLQFTYPGIFFLVVNLRNLSFGSSRIFNHSQNYFTSTRMRHICDMQSQITGTIRSRMCQKHEMFSHMNDALICEEFRHRKKLWVNRGENRLKNELNVFLSLYHSTCMEQNLHIRVSLASKYRLQLRSKRNTQREASLKKGGFSDRARVCSPTVRFC